MFFREYCQLFKSTYFEKHLRTAASLALRFLVLLNFSSQFLQQITILFLIRFLQSLNLIYLCTFSNTNLSPLPLKSSKRLFQPSNNFFLKIRRWLILPLYFKFRNATAILAFTAIPSRSSVICMLLLNLEGGVACYIRNDLIYYVKSCFPKDTDKYFLNDYHQTLKQ